MASAHGQRVASILNQQLLDAANQQNIQTLNRDYGQARDDLNNSGNSALAQLGSGYDSARGEYGQAAAKYDPYASAGLTALGQYGNTIGLNGQSGYDQATAAFRASPGYQYSVDQSTDQIARKQSALGALGSGNTMAAISDRAGNMADQEYGNYQNRLQGMSQMGLQATGAQAGLTKGIGDLYAAQGTAGASVYDDLGRSLASLQMAHGNQTASSNMQAATGVAAGNTAAGEAGDAASMANQNLLLGIGGSLLGLKMPGANGGTLGGSALSGLGSFFKL
jgi:hypothetical protein